MEYVISGIVVVVICAIAVILVQRGNMEADDGQNQLEGEKAKAEGKVLTLSKRLEITKARVEILEGQIADRNAEIRELKTQVLEQERAGKLF